MKIFVTLMILPIVLFFTADVSWALKPSPTHQEMTKAIENATEWAKHLEKESAKRGKMDTAHVTQEIQGVRDSVKAMESAYSRLSAESPSDAAEGHFIALKQHQLRVSEFIDQFETEMKKPDPNYSLMKHQSREVLRQLEAAKHEHGLELTEIEAQH